MHRFILKPMRTFPLMNLLFGEDSVPEPNPEELWPDEYDDYGSDTESESDESILGPIDDYETDEYYTDSDFSLY